jgi:hypothetical protein
VAILYHGHYDRSFRGQCSDFFEVAHNHAAQLFNPLSARGIKLSVFFHTYRHSFCKQKDDSLVAFLRPTRHEFSESSLPRIVDSYIRVLQLARAANPAPDVLLICRFDIVFTWNCLDLNIEWQKINLAWRDERSAWLHLHKSNDLFIALPFQHAIALEKAFDDSAKRSPSGDGNFLFKSLALAVGPSNIRFIDSEFRTSTVDARWITAHRNDTGGAKVFIAIERSCKGKAVDVSIRQTQSSPSCWRGSHMPWINDGIIPINSEIGML